MSRSGFYEVDDWDRDLILAIGRVQARIASARRGKRGQAFLRKALAALDQMEDKRLAGGTFGVSGGCMCIMSSIATETGKAAAIEGYDKYCGEVVCQRLARGFDVAHVLIQDLVWQNDEIAPSDPVARWVFMRGEIERAIDDKPLPQPPEGE